MHTALDHTVDRFFSINSLMNPTSDFLINICQKYELKPILGFERDEVMKCEKKRGVKKTVMECA